MQRLLTIATSLCGERAAATVFEPLIADWQHELETARQAGRGRYAIAFLSGAAAYLRSLTRCAMNRGWLPTPRAAQLAAVTFFVALTAALILLWLALLSSGRTSDVRSVAAQSYLLSAAGVVVAPVMLPVLFLMRRDARSTTRHAISGIGAGVLLTAGVVTLTSPESLNRYFSTFESSEAEYQRNLANDRAGRVTYPGTAIRQLRGETTIEERRAQHERFMAWRAAQEAARPPLTWHHRARRMLQPVALAVLFGVMGWTLAGLGPVTVARAAMWWALMLVALLMFRSLPGRMTFFGIPKLPDAYAVPVFGSMTLALVIAGRRRHHAPARGTNL